MDKEKQIIISISREYGSGGHGVALALGELMGLPVYDKNIIHEIAKQKEVDMSEWESAEEKPLPAFLYKKVGKFSTDPTDMLHEMEFDFMREKADAGESFIILGRCSDCILKDREGLIKVFIKGEVEDKVPRLMARLNESEEAARADVVKIDRLRRKYHNKYCDTKWGDSRHYDICIDTKIGVPETAQILEAYIRKIIENM